MWEAFSVLGFLFCDTQTLHSDTNEGSRPSGPIHIHIIDCRNSTQGTVHSPNGRHDKVLAVGWAHT